MFEAETLALAQAVLDACRARNWKLATAESCTGGLVVGALTAIGGSSDVVERGFVTYSNEAKSELLGVPPEIIAEHGAVSAETAAAMAQGALARAPVDLAVSVTGIAGPGGATPLKPLGLAFVAAADAERSLVREHRWAGDRAANRHASGYTNDWARRSKRAIAEHVRQHGMVCPGYGRDAHDPALYHLVVDSTVLPVEVCVRVIVEAATAFWGDR